MNVILSALLLLVPLMGGRLAVCAFSDESPALQLLPRAEAGGDGIYLSQVLSNGAALAVPRVRLGDAPAFGRSTSLTRDAVLRALKQARPDGTAIRLLGAERVNVHRQARLLEEAEVKELLSAVLQQNYVREQGELDLRLTRPWSAIAVPDDPLTVNVIEVPPTGIGPFFIVRFEVRAGEESIGDWQVALNAKVWREIWVARSPVRRGQLLPDADVVRERRDVLALRDMPLEIEQLDDSIELAMNLVAGSPVYERSVRLRPVLKRGQLVEAQIREGTLVVSLKVEVLEDGAPGQWVRLRNLQSKRELRGRVSDGATVIVSL